MRLDGVARKESAASRRERCSSIAATIRRCSFSGGSGSGHDRRTVWLMFFCVAPLPACARFRRSARRYQKRNRESRPCLGSAKPIAWFVAISMPAIPSFPIEPYIAIRTVPGGTSLALLSARPSSVIVPAVVVTRPSFRSPMMAHGIDPP